MVDQSAVTAAAQRDEFLRCKFDDFEAEVQRWSFTNRDPLVGAFDAHNVWPDYDTTLFRDISTGALIALDFGCGVGRNIVKFHRWFRQIDGVDLSPTALRHAAAWIAHKCPDATPALYRTNGWDLRAIGDATYDMVFSTITLQHIPVHAIRLSLFCAFHRILKRGGHLCFQMGYGPGHPRSVPYHADAYDTPFMDTRVEDTDHLVSDLHHCGFEVVRPVLRPVGPGDRHRQWIFVHAQRGVALPSWRPPWAGMHHD